MLRGQLTAWREAKRGTAPQYLVLEPRDHGWTMRRPADVPYVDPQSTTKAMHLFLDDYLGPLVPFFDHFLRSQGDYTAAPVRWRTGTDAWHESADWPPEGIEETTQFLSTAGRLRPQLPSRSTSARWTHDPTDPVPSLTHPYYPLVDQADERATLRRPDVLAFATEPLTQSTLLIGPAHLALDFTATSASAHVIATLYDVSPEGQATRIADGAMAVTGPWPRQLCIDLGDLGYELTEAHQLALAVAGSSFPRYLLHPGNDSDPWTTTALNKSTLAITLGGPSGSRLVYHSNQEAHR
jgi:putative CocE/NonD family hydrolase